MHCSEWQARLAIFAGVWALCLSARTEEICSLATGVPVRQQFGWVFARTPMVGAPRSIAIPLATNLHVAFDAKTLRLHTAWTGGKLRLAGYPFGEIARPFSSFTGSVLWSTPFCCPWLAGARPTNAWPEMTPGSDFRGLSTKGGVVTLLYDVADSTGGVVRIHESSRAQRLEEGVTAIRRRLEIAPTRQTLWFLAHAETGKAARRLPPAEGILIPREKDFLVAAIGGADATAVLDELPTNQCRLWLQIPPHHESVALEIASAVCASEAQAGQVASTLATVPIALPRMDFLTSPEKDPLAKPLPAFRSSAQPVHADGDEFYRREQFPVPKELDLLVGGMDWLPNGDLALSTWPGEVYIARGATGPATNVTWRRFACGLNEPLGLKVVHGQIHVVQKCELTRLVDTDGNGEADLYESLNDDWGFDGNTHYFAYGPALDTAGNFYVTLDGNTSDWHPRWELPFRGWAVKINPSGHALEGFSSGLRSPNGCFTYGPDRDVFCTDNEGHWMGTCKLNWCRPGKFFGYPSSTPMPRETFQKPSGFDPPAVWFPRKLCTSASGGTEITDARFGPFAGQMLVGDFGTASILRVALERVNGEWQGAVWPFERGFLSGVNRLTFGSDGRLYLGCLRRGWGSSGPQEFSLERIDFNGQTPFEIREVHARPDGFELHFTQPVDRATATNQENWEMTQFHYRFSAAYGSPEIDQAGKENSATPITVTQAILAPDQQRLELKLTGWKTGYVTAVRNKAARSNDGKGLWHDTFYYTLNGVPK
jgi:glucose/arabinose dehydrogenase